MSIIILFWNIYILIILLVSKTVDFYPLIIYMLKRQPQYLFYHFFYLDIFEEKYSKRNF